MKLSVCLIVKNEERVLARCLECASQFADELIVVDTGSTDHSMEIAAKYTPKVFFHPWQGSFAEARNYAYSLTTCEYMMWLDADDVIDEENIGKFLKLKQKISGDIDVVFTIYRNYNEDGIGDYILRDRIIRRSLDPKWVGAVHEAIPLSPLWKCVYASDITIVHKKEYVNDVNRNMGIFNKMVKEGKNFSNFDKANYCKELVIAKDYEKAYSVFKQIKQTADDICYYCALFFVVNGLIADKKYNECITEIEELDRKMSITAYMVYKQGLCYEKLGNLSKAKECYRRAMTIPEAPSTLFIQYTGCADYFPMLRLAIIAAIEGDRRTAKTYLDKASMLYPKNKEWKNAKINLMLLSYKHC
ncbi:MAG: glycosyltransferase [Prevotellaceae bacterium]|nr:glycosyltransferase [Prevotellaceae bacterium]